MPSPYAKALVSVNTAAKVSGGTTVPSAASVVFTGESTTGWQSQKWELYDYPTGFTAPTGWSTDANGVIFSTDVAPTAIALPANTTRWGKYALRLTVVPVGGGASLVDEQTMLSMLSPKGQRAIAFNETTQFGGARKAIAAEYQANLVTIESQLGTGGGGSTPTGTGLRKVVGGAENAAASLLVNADVDPAAAIAASKIAAPGASGNPLVNSASAIGAATNWTMGTGLAGGAGSFLSIGTAPNIGEIRLPNGGTIYGLGPAASNAQLLRYGNGGGYLLEIGETGLVGETRLIATSGGGGSITGYLGAGNVFSFATSGTSFAVGGVTFLNMTSAYGTIEAWKPLSGSYTNSSPFKWGATSVASANAGVTLTMVQCYCPNIVFTSGATATFAATGAPTGAGVEYLVANESGQAMTFMGIAIANGATSRIAYNTTAAAWRKVS